MCGPVSLTWQLHGNGIPAWGRTPVFAFIISKVNIDFLTLD